MSEPLALLRPPLREWLLFCTLMPLMSLTTGTSDQFPHSPTRWLVPQPDVPVHSTPSVEFSVIASQLDDNAPFPTVNATWALSCSPLDRHAVITRVPKSKIHSSFIPYNFSVFTTQFLYTAQSLGFEYCISSGYLMVLEFVVTGPGHDIPNYDIHAFNLQTGSLQWTKRITIALIDRGLTEQRWECSDDQVYFFLTPARGSLFATNNPTVYIFSMDGSNEKVVFQSPAYHEEVHFALGPSVFVIMSQPLPFTLQSPSKVIAYHRGPPYAISSTWAVPGLDFTVTLPQVLQASLVACVVLPEPGQFVIESYDVATGARRWSSNHFNSPSSAPQLIAVDWAGNETAVVIGNPGTMTSFITVINNGATVRTLTPAAHQTAWVSFTLASSKDCFYVLDSVGGLYEFSFAGALRSSTAVPSQGMGLSFYSVFPNAVMVLAQPTSVHDPPSIHIYRDTSGASLSPYASVPGAVGVCINSENTLYALTSSQVAPTTYNYSLAYLPQPWISPSPSPSPSAGPRTPFPFVFKWTIPYSGSPITSLVDINTAAFLPHDNTTIIETNANGDLAAVFTINSSLTPVVGISPGAYFSLINASTLNAMANDGSFLYTKVFSGLSLLQLDVLEGRLTTSMSKGRTLALACTPLRDSPVVAVAWNTMTGEEVWRAQLSFTTKFGFYLLSYTRIQRNGEDHSLIFTIPTPNGEVAAYAVSTEGQVLWHSVIMMDTCRFVDSALPVLLHDGTVVICSSKTTSVGINVNNGEILGPFPASTVVSSGNEFLVTGNYFVAHLLFNDTQLHVTRYSLGGVPLGSRTLNATFLDMAYLAVGTCDNVMYLRLQPATLTALHMGDGSVLWTTPLDPGADLVEIGGYVYELPMQQSSAITPQGNKLHLNGIGDITRLVSFPNRHDVLAWHSSAHVSGVAPLYTGGCPSLPPHGPSGSGPPLALVIGGSVAGAVIAIVIIWCVCRRRAYSGLTITKAPLTDAQWVKLSGERQRFAEVVRAKGVLFPPHWELNRAAAVHIDPYLPAKAESGHSVLTPAIYRRVNACVMPVPLAGRSEPDEKPSEHTLTMSPLMVDSIQQPLLSDNLSAEPRKRNKGSRAPPRNITHGWPKASPGEANTVERALHATSSSITNRTLMLYGSQQEMPSLQLQADVNRCCGRATRGYFFKQWRVHSVDRIENTQLWARIFNLCVHIILFQEDEILVRRAIAAYEAEDLGNLLSIAGFTIAYHGSQYFSNITSEGFREPMRGKKSANRTCFSTCRRLPCIRRCFKDYYSSGHYLAMDIEYVIEAFAPQVRDPSSGFKGRSILVCGILGGLPPFSLPLSSPDHSIDAETRLYQNGKYTVRSGLHCSRNGCGGLSRFIVGYSNAMVVPLYIVNCEKKQDSSCPCCV